MDEGVWAGAVQDVKGIRVQISNLSSRLASHNCATLKYWLEVVLVIYS